MTVLLVDSEAERLQSTALLLKKALPECDIMSTADPLTAAKHVFGNPVDVLFAFLNMKRMSGLQLCEFVRDKSPGTRTCLLASRQEFGDCPEIFEDYIRCVNYPATQEALRRAAATDC